MKGKKSKQKIYETAKRLFLEEGYLIGNRRIATEANVSLGLIAYHFSSKRNIAVAILKEDYTILSAHLKNYLTPDQDILLYVLCFTNMTLRIREHDYKMARFTTEIMKDDILEASIYDGNQKHEYAALMELMEEDIAYEKKLKLALGTIFGVQRALQWNINDGMDLSYQDYFEYMVKTYSFALDLNYGKPKIKEIVKKSNTIVDEVFKDYGHLLDTSRYLYGQVEIEK